MAFVYEKILEEEKENLKIKLKEAEKLKTEKEYEKYDAFFGVDNYLFHEDNMWIKNNEMDIFIVR